MESVMPVVDTLSLRVRDFSLDPVQVHFQSSFRLLRLIVHILNSSQTKFVAIILIWHRFSSDTFEFLSSKMDKQVNPEAIKFS